MQRISEGTLGKMEQFREKMASSYEDLADQEEALTEEIELMGKRIDSMGREDPGQLKENLRSHNRETKSQQQPRLGRKAEEVRNEGLKGE